MSPLYYHPDEDGEQQSVSMKNNDIHTEPSALSEKKLVAQPYLDHKTEEITIRTAALGFHTPPSTPLIIANKTDDEQSHDDLPEVKSSLHHDCTDFSNPTNPDVPTLIQSMASKDVHNPQDKISVLNSAREIIRQLKDPTERAFELMFSFPVLPCLSIAVDMGVFTFLAEKGAVTAHEIAEQAGAEEDFVVRIMRVLTAEDIVTIRSPRLYASTPISNAFANPSIAAGISVCSDQGSRACNRLPEWTRAHSFRNPTDPKNGVYQFAFNSFDTWWMHLAKNPRMNTNFNRFMTGFRDMRASASWCDVFPVEKILFDGLTSAECEDVAVVDVGGGVGHDMQLLRSALSRPLGRVAVQDQENVVSTVAQDENVGIEFQAHDFFAEQPVRGARAYVLKHILHDWPHAQAVSILKCIREAMKPGHSRVLVLDLIMPDKKVSIKAAAMDMIMMAGFAATERCIVEWGRLVKDAGLVIREVFGGKDGDGFLVLERIDADCSDVMDQ